MSARAARAVFSRQVVSTPIRNQAALVTRGGPAPEGGNFIERMPREYLVLSILGGYVVIGFAAKKAFSGGSKEKTEA